MQFLKTKNKTALTVTGLTLLIAASALWLDDKDAQPSTAVTPTAQTNLPDYFMEDYNIISTDTNGQPHRWLSGKTLQHFPNGDINLTQPMLQFRKQPRQQFDEKEQGWLLSAEKGTIHSDNIYNDNAEKNQKQKKLTFDGNVNIVRSNEQQSSLIIQTEHLDISMANNAASTHSNVKVINDNGEITAKGFTINFDDQQLHLLSQVKGHYVFK